MVTLRQLRLTFCKSKTQKILALGIVVLVVCGVAYVWGGSDVTPSGDHHGDGGGVPGGMRWGGASAKSDHPHRKRHKLIDEAVGQMAACLSPSLILLNSTMQDLSPAGRLSCGHSELLKLATPGRSRLEVRNDVLGGRQLARCQYLGIEWIGDSSYRYVDLGQTTRAPFGMEVTDHDFVRVRCHLHTSELKRRKLLSKEMEDGPHYLGSLGLPDPPAINRSLKNKHKNSTVANAKKQTNNTNINIPNHPAGVEETKIKQGEGGSKDAQKHSNDDPVPDRVANSKMDDTDPGQVVRSTMRQTRTSPAARLVRSEVKREPVMLSDMTDVADFDQFLAMVQRNPEVQERLESDSAPDKDSLKMNVLILNVEAISHRDIPHVLAQTYSFLMDRLKALLLRTYNSAGSTKAEALFPLITGRPLSDFPEAMPDTPESMYLDSLPFVWKRFEQDGYATLFAEDMPHLNALQSGLTGLEHIPTDHFMRTFWLAAADSTVQKASRSFCLGGKPVYQHTLDYIESFYARYHDVSKFAMASVGYHSKDGLVARYMDTAIHGLLQRLDATGSLDKTLVILMSDHGTLASSKQHTAQAKLAIRHPFMALALPSWFHTNYPDLVERVRSNAARLTTPFDVFSTLKDLLDIKRVKEPLPPERGTSLFRNIPLNRTCEQASIPSHWCACLSLVPAEVKSAHAKESARVLVEHINHLTSHVRTHCEKLEFQLMKDFNILTPNDQVLKYQSPDATRKSEQNVIYYHVTIKTSPNDAIYQAAVERDPVKGTYRVINDVQRTTRYGRSGRCVSKEHPHLRKFCHCADE